MKIFLGNSPWSKKGYYGVRAGSRWPHFEEEGNLYMPFPFFLAYTAAVLEGNGFEVLLTDGIAEKINEDEFVNRIKEFSPDLILLEVSTISIETDLSLVKKLRKIYGDSKKIVLAGLHAFMYEPDFLSENKDIDYILIGEYEYTLLDLVKYLSSEKRQGIEKIKGLVFRDDNNNSISTGRRMLFLDINKYPWPARNHLPMDNYHDEPGNIPQPSVQMWASRGCPYGCIFCAWPQIMYGSTKYRVRDIKDVVDEMEWLVRDWGFKSVYFDDDTFNIGKERMLTFCREVKSRNLGVPWAIMARPDNMDEEILVNMKGAGLYSLKYGVESRDQSLLKACHKQSDIEKAIDNIKLTKKLGIKYHLTFMFGLPGETEETARKTIDLALELDPESVQFTIATPFPGTKFYRMMEESGAISHNDYVDYDGFRRSVIHTSNLTSDDLERIAAQANKEWKEHVNKRAIRINTGASEEGNEKVDRSLKSKLISVIIPNWNGSEWIDKCLNSLKLQDIEELEVICVDNGSTDGSIEKIKCHYPKAKIIELNENKGFAYAVNRGIESSSGDFIFLLNNDVVLEKNCLKQMVSVLSERNDIGFCTPKILMLDESNYLYSAGDGLTRSGYSFNRGNGILDDGKYDESCEVLGAPGCAALYRRYLFGDIGFFDETFNTYLEDLDFSIRAQLWGYRCLYVPTAKAYHKAHATFGKQYNRQSVYFISRNTICLLLKNIPRTILKDNIFRITKFIIAMKLFHLFKTKHPLIYLKGLKHGIALRKEMIRKRKRILGGQRVPDSKILEYLHWAEEELKKFKKRTSFFI